MAVPAAGFAIIVALTTARPGKEARMTESPEILFERRGHAGLVTLNRPKALNALTLPMVRQMHPQLAEWARDPEIAHVVVRAAGEKAFCAGGDIRQLHDWGRAGDRRFIDFYRE